MTNLPDNQPADIPTLSEEERHKLDLAVDLNVRIIAAAYEKASAYANLLIVAGYAGFFALWQMTKDYLGRKQTLLSALLMLVSLIVFIVFEIYKGHYTSRFLKTFHNSILKREHQTSLGTFVEQMTALEQAERQGALRFLTFWNMTFWVTTITGLGAGFILAVSLVHRLLQ